jgi:hypothetical protein
VIPTLLIEFDNRAAIDLAPKFCPLIFLASLMSVSNSDTSGESAATIGSTGI